MENEQNNENEIEIPHFSNSMQGTYKVIGLDYSEIKSEITVKVGKYSDVLAEISPKVTDNNERLAQVMIKYGGVSEVYAEIDPVGGVLKDAQIYIRPGNRMTAIYEVQEPPKITTCLEPYKDAYTRESTHYSAINYGGNNSLIVGRDGNEIYRSYLQFDFTNWEQYSVLIEAKLRLHYNGTLPDGMELEILSLDRVWGEYSITHQNRPTPIEMIVDDYSHNKAERYVEFPITEAVYNWIEGNAVNNGFIVRVKNETVQGAVTFRARETNRPPQLCITHYDNRIYSAGRTETRAEIEVIHADNSDRDAEITVKSVFGSSARDAQLYVHRYEDPVDNDKNAEITVTRVKADGEVTVFVVDDNEIWSEVSVRSEMQHRVKDAQITVSKANQLAEIFVRFESDKDAEVIVRRLEESVKSSLISVTREKIDAEIEVYYKEDRHAEVTVSRSLDNGKDSVVAVTREKIDAEVYAKHNDDKDAQIRVVYPASSDKDSAIAVTRSSIYAEISSKVAEYNDRDAEVSVSVWDKSIKDSHIAVTRSSVLAEIEVVETSDKDSEIYVKHRSDKHTEINVHVHNSVDAEIDVIKVFKKDASVSVTRRQVDAEIMIPYWADSDKDTELQVRVLRVDDKYAEIRVADIAGAYAFII